MATLFHFLGIDPRVQFLWPPPVPSCRIGPGPGAPADLTGRLPLPIAIWREGKQKKNLECPPFGSA
jgi:hypothetical protein